MAQNLAITKFLNKTILRFFTYTCNFSPFKKDIKKAIDLILNPLSTKVFIYLFLQKTYGVGERVRTSAPCYRPKRLANAPLHRLGTPTYIFLVLKFMLNLTYLL